MKTSDFRRAAAFAPPFLLIGVFFSLAGAEEAPVPAPSLAEWSPPEVESAKPTAEEWASAAPLDLLRPHKYCTASAVREWLRISCKEPFGVFKGVRVIGGSEKDVSIIDYKTKGIGQDLDTGKESEKTLDGLHVVFPVRKEDQRVMSFVTWVSGGWKSWYIREDTFVTISELWLPGEQRPTIVLY